MSIAKLKTRIKNFNNKVLVDFGFNVYKPTVLERQLNGFIQGIEFQTGDGRLTDKFTVNIYWKFTIVSDKGSLSGCQRLENLSPENKDLWFKYKDCDIDEEFTRCKELIMQFAIPHLEKYKSIENIVEAYEAEALKPYEAFSEDKGWLTFDLASCYYFLNQYDKALDRFKEVIEYHSWPPLDFMVTRKEESEMMIKKINSLLKPTKLL